MRGILFELPSQGTPNGRVNYHRAVCEIQVIDFRFLIKSLESKYPW